MKREANCAERRQPVSGPQAGRLAAAKNAYGSMGAD